jgi:hypothetical protein
MARELVLPDAWVDQEVNITYIGAGKTNDVNCTLRDVNERGVGVERGDTTSFFPWTSVVKIDRGHASRDRKRLRLQR